MHIRRLALLTALLLSLLGCSKQPAPTKAAAAGPMAVPVTVANVVQRSMPVQLFVNDPCPFAAAMQQAQANLEKDKAAARNAEVDAHRYEQLFQAGVIPRQQYDQYRTTSDTLTATVAADQAAVETARLQLSYTTVH